ncbi:MAG: ROK family protein [Acidobacteria bacterium]|nr:ROK family protein [Acidobacteriota bacterium]
MADSTTTLRGPVLAVDIGATFIKFCPVDEDGHLLGDVTRLYTPFPCWPSTLIDVVSRVINESGLSRAGVGFPGDMADGRVIEPGNLSRAGGITTPIDPAIERAWVGVDVQAQLRSRCGARVRVVNDATLAAFGYAEGEGRELVLTLGTGLGISLVVNGEWRKIRDVGAAMYHDVGTYDEVFGEPSRAADVATWRRRLGDAIGEFVQEFDAELVHVGGGNARHVRARDLADVGCRVVFNDNDGTLRGAARLLATS